MSNTYLRSQWTVFERHFVVVDLLGNSTMDTASKLVIKVAIQKEKAILLRKTEMIII